MSTWGGTDPVRAGGSAAVGETTNLRKGTRIPRKQKWTPEGDECLVMLLQEDHKACNSFASSFKCEVWTRIWTAYAQKTEEDVTVSQLRNRWKTLKKIYRLYSSLLNKSGWTWDYVQHRPTPDNAEVWDDVLKVKNDCLQKFVLFDSSLYSQDNKEYKIARERSFPLYWAMHELAGTSTATGRYALGSTDDKTVVDIDEGSGSSDNLMNGSAGGQKAIRKDDADVVKVAMKRKKAQAGSSKLGKKSTEHTLETLDQLVELSDHRSRIVEQYKDEDESFLYKLCMEKLTTIPDVTAEEIFVGGQAFKQREERIFFLTVPTSAVSFWLEQRVNDF